MVDFDCVVRAPSPVQAERSSAGTNLPGSSKTAIIAALEREVRPLVKHWRIATRQFQGRRFKFFERDRAVLVCGGIGAEAARIATEAIISLYHPVLIQSVGFAGGLDSTLRVGNIFVPGCVVDARDGSKLDIGSGTGTLLSAPSVAGSAQKAKFASAYGANAIDMEAAAVGRVAESHGIKFQAVKAISDEHDFDLPQMQSFIRPDGTFRSIHFAAFAALRPWLWIKVSRLAKNSAAASKALCRWLDQQNPNYDKLDNSGHGPHQMEMEHQQPGV